MTNLRILKGSHKRPGDALAPSDTGGMTRLLQAYAAAVRRWHGTPEAASPDVVNIADRRALRRAA